VVAVSFFPQHFIPAQAKYFLFRTNKFLFFKVS
jgi:hypothetical protein